MSLIGSNKNALENTPTELAYKVYTALLTQRGISDPTAIVLENTLVGVPVFTYNNVGNYTITLVGAFTLNKTLCFTLCPTYTPNDLSGLNNNRIGVIDADTINIQTYDAGFAPQDSFLNESPIEIRVYN